MMTNPFWGSMNGFPSSQLVLLNNVFFSECRAVYILITDGGKNNESFQLTGISPSSQLHGILCENG